MSGRPLIRYEKFLESFTSLVAHAPVEYLAPTSRIVVIGDLWMGDGGRSDTLSGIRDILEPALSGWYGPAGYSLVANGDCEDLRSFWRKDILKAWGNLYGIFGEFHNSGHFWKILGERDLGLLRKPDYPWPLLHCLILDAAGKKIVILHGHQASKYFAGRDYRHFVDSYIIKPRRIQDENDMADPDRLYRTERRLYQASADMGLVTISGHTGRALFASRTIAWDLRTAVESLVREKGLPDPSSGPGFVDALIDLYRKEIRRERGEAADLPRRLESCAENPLKPLLFNPGPAAGMRCLNTLEIEAGTIRLVRWMKKKTMRPWHYTGIAGSRESPNGKLVATILAEMPLEACWIGDSNFTGKTDHP